ncbi:alpha carbonic anhydrase 7-like [Senna tora]|uniref:Alpha carbonic anhydrase 7-like n=1 Tax=Senna tora TaxID=362788 RepID=A0A834SJ00_9FABA|nr:alpha carbonic anhydrase 7-like [Senna tora]
MKHPTLLILLTIFLYYSTLSRAQEVEDEREFDYIKGSEKGPSHWGELKREWEACQKGRMQSPIDLWSERVRVIPKLGQLNNTYKPQNATLKNRGHDIEVKWEGDAGSIPINGSHFFLRQSHWHSPSEHTINGRRCDLELHMVHVRPNPEGRDKIAVVGLLYKIGPPDPFLSKLEKHMRGMVDIKGEKSIGVINPLDIIKMGGNKYYRYMGSLTVPPCTQGVIWTINKKIKTVSREQVKLLREAVHDYAERNARPVQPLNRREIHLYSPRNKPHN